MKHILSNPWHEVLRFDQGDDVVVGILKFVEEKRIEAAWLSAIGSSKEVELGFYDLDKKEYFNKVFTEPLEILEASGTLAIKDKKPILHWHGVFGGADYDTIGGHIQRLIANATVEVFIHKLNPSTSFDSAQDKSFGAGERLERKKDPETGLATLD